MSLLSQSLTLPCGQTLPNRLAKSAMSEALGTDDNRATPELTALYGAWAEGQLGLSITGNVMVDRRALGEPGNVVIEDARDLAELSRWATAGQRAGGRIWVQLNHPGKQSPKGLNAETIAPSAIPFKADMQAFFATPREMTETEIQEVIARFATAAAVVKEAGFDGVQIHGAHGYLVSQFLSPHHNQRQDAWGGDAVRRRRFVLAVYEAMRAAVGPTFPIGIKLNSADFQRGGFTEEESLDVIDALVAAGIDLVEISGGTYEAPAMAGLRQTERTQAREAYFLSFAEQVRARSAVPLMVTGGFRTQAGMQAALASGALDLVGLARPLAVEPDLPRRLLAGADPRHAIQPLSTGIGRVDRMGLLEVVWYTRQLHRIARGQPTRPREPALWAMMGYLARNARGTWRTRRLRASS